MEKYGFHGSTKECLRHYAESFPKTTNKQEIGEARKPIAQFVGAQANTVADWFNGKYLPDGEFLIKLRYFLESVGYHVEEIKAVAPDIQELGRHIAYDRISADEVTERLELRPRSYVYRILRGEVDPRLSTWGEKLPPLLRECRNGAEGAPEEKEKIVQQKTDESAANHMLIVHALADLVLAAIPLAEQVISNLFSVEDRQTLRRLTKETGIFRLSNLLNGLCGEKAREIIKRR